MDQPLKKHNVSYMSHSTGSPKEDDSCSSNLNEENQLISSTTTYNDFNGMTLNVCCFHLKIGSHAKNCVFKLDFCFLHLDCMCGCSKCCK